MRIIGFFSFKGGVGRTALLSNLGAHWAARGRVVALMDLDLIAPGVSYSPRMGEYLDQRAVGLGMSDLLAAYHDRDPKKDTFEFLPPSLLLREMKLSKGSAPGGRLLAIGAGSPAGGDAYAKKAESQAAGILRPIPRAAPDPNAPDAEPFDARVLRGLARHIREDLTNWRTPPRSPGDDSGNEAAEPDPGAGRPIDYLLIDARTGFAELADLGLGYLADHMVLVSGLNEQNLQGLRLTMRALWEKGRVPLDEMPSLVTVVFSPVPAGEDDAVLKALEDARRALAENLRLTRAGQPELMPRTFRIHYTPRLALSDAPLLPERPDSLYAREARAIADHLAGETISGERFQEELAEIGRRTLRVFQEFGNRPATASDPHGRPNPFTDLPPWHWPLGEGASDRDRKRHTRKMVGKLPPAIRANTDAFLDRLAWAISLDLPQKKEILATLPRIGLDQWETLRQNMEAERTWVLAQWRETEHRRPLMISLLKAGRGWATLVSEEKPLDGRAPHQRCPLPHIEPWPQYWLALAWETIERGDAEEAVLAAADEAIQRAAPEEAPELAEWLMQLVPLEADRAELVAELEARARGIAPEHGWLDYLAARRLLQGPKKDPVRAEALLRPLLKTPPTDAEKCNDLGVLAQGLPGMAAQAEAAFRNSIELDPELAVPWYNLGNLLAEHPGRHEDAAAAYRGAMELEPELAAPWNGLGNLQRDWQQDCRGALETFRLGLERAGDDKSSQTLLRMNLGHTLQLLGRPARTNLESALALFDEQNNHVHALRLALELGDAQRTAKYLAICRELAATGKGGNYYFAASMVACAEWLNIDDSGDDIGVRSSPQPTEPASVADLAQRIANAPRDWAQYWDTIELIYFLCGFRPDARPLGRAAVKALLELPAAVTDRYPDKPRPDDWRARYLPFANGESDGAGDPRDRHLFCREPQADRAE
uniref:Uncharacterized protein n=1 Tax=Candidatus Kentrum sp. TC TaxID=2126339 RepID=A0A450YAY1_9GAMM|nr:MAG: hypothetical protein BECKTC1821D_GA0114238_100542 [Candidatus Kentron sp. TC]